MKSKSLYALTILFCLCMFSVSSKECGKAIDGKTPAGAGKRKPPAGNQTEVKAEAQSEFSFLHTIFFQTT
ncbi:MAG: hypothetical protein JST47_05735 [Bacteroidetes bacterium]|nr:hypothetical protein [Bacteroidota bacterium]MBS1974003.1 hypothetical protein [Bacteroidota bacterium]